MIEAPGKISVISGLYVMGFAATSPAMTPLFVEFGWEVVIDLNFRNEGDSSRGQAFQEVGKCRYQVICACNHDASVAVIVLCQCLIRSDHLYIKNT
jgi:hypothetical protein